MENSSEKRKCLKAQIVFSHTSGVEGQFSFAKEFVLHLSHCLAFWCRQTETINTEALWIFSSNLLSSGYSFPKTVTVYGIIFHYTMHSTKHLVEGGFAEVKTYENLTLS